jgi:hypothetical protein
MSADLRNFNVSQLVEAIASELFRLVQTLELWRFISHIVFFITAITSLLGTGYFIYVTTILALFAGVIAFALRLFANRYNTLGHSLHRIAMLSKAYRMNSDKFDVSYLLTKVPPRVYEIGVKEAKSSKLSSEYSLPTNGNEVEKLRWMIQENAFFNNTLYDACADKAQRILLIVIILVLLCTFLLIPIADGQAKDFLLRATITFFSLTILYDQFEQWMSWRVASRLMLDLENELARFETVPDHRVMLLFSNYQVAICGTPAIEPGIYQKNRDKLNIGWEQRVATLKRDWA